MAAKRLLCSIFAKNHPRPTIALSVNNQHKQEDGLHNDEDDCEDDGDEDGKDDCEGDGDEEDNLPF